MRIMFTLTSALLALAICASAAQDAATQSSAPAAIIPKVNYCELIKNARKYHNQIVEITAVIERGFEISFLYDDECQKDLNKRQTWVSYDKSFRAYGDSEEVRINNQINGSGTWELTGIGKFRRAEGSQRFGHLGCCRYDFALIKVERAEKLTGVR